MADVDQSADHIAEPTAVLVPKSLLMSDSRRTLRSAHPSEKNHPSHTQTLLVRRKRKDEVPWRSLRRWFVQNQIGLAINLLALLILAHLSIPRSRVHTRKFFTLAYHNPQTDRYAPGPDDGFLIAFLVILLIFLRASAVQHMLIPLGQKLGITKPKTIIRFSEQAWTMTIYLCLWIVGMYNYSRSSSILSKNAIFPSDWPIREESWSSKIYFLTQLSSCLHQILVLHIEDARKDHYQMLTHHFVTFLLLIMSYFYHFTQIGNLILVLMDPADILLPLAKCLRYAGYTTLCDFTFGLFVMTWFICRHVLYPISWYSMYNGQTYFIGRECYRGTQNNLSGPMTVPKGYGYLFEPFFYPQGYVCASYPILSTFIGSLAFLHLIVVFWFVMIVQVAIRVVRGKGAADTRSDDENPEVDDVDTNEEASPIEQESGVEEINFKIWERRAGVKRQAISSAVTLPGHSDRKELLGRIGCDKHGD